MRCKQAVIEAAGVTDSRLSAIYLWMHAPCSGPVAGRPPPETQSGAHCSDAQRACSRAGWVAARDRPRRRGGPRVVAAVVALAGVAVLVAGCGGGSGLTVASMPGRGTTGRHVPSSRSSSSGGVRFVGAAPSPVQRAGAEVVQLKFSRCMRSHGVPNFPDPPSASGGGFGFAFGGSGIDPGAPLFREAQRSCISVLTRQRVVVG